MASNFDFLQKIDSELYEIIEDAQKLFRSEYFNQSVIQVRIFAERMTKNICANNSSNFSFDEMLNNLKDKIKTQREKEFVEDLFFIKKQGNACAHGEKTTAQDVLEVLKRAFEVSINYAYFKTKNEETDKLLFDTTLLITQKPQEENKLIDKYLQRAQEEDKEGLLNKKQGDFLAEAKNNLCDDETKLKDKNFVKNANQYKKTNSKTKVKKELTPKQKEIKDKIKKAKKNLKENINNEIKKQKQPSKKPTQPKKKKAKSTIQIEKELIKTIAFLFLILISLLFLSKFIF